MAAELQEPTKPQNAYWLWLADNREALTKEAGSAAGSVVGKFAGQKWKAMSAEQKKPFDEEAAKRKATYEKAMEVFKASGGQPGKRRQEKQQAKQVRGDKKARKEARKASGKPVKPQTGYWLFLAENRQAITKEAGTAKPPVVAKLAGEKWKGMSEAQRKPFETKAKELRAVYEKALEEWKQSGGDNGEDGEDDDQGEEDA